jgi:hypothetical protein
MTKKIILIICLLGFKLTYSQNLLIGNLVKNQVVYSEKSLKAMNITYMRTFNDGRKLDSSYIEYIGSKKYLILIGNKAGVKSKSALTIKIENGNLLINELLEIKTCTNNDCATCTFFVENDKINACNCSSEGTVSNHCTYKVNDGSFFYKLFKRIIEN